MIKENSGNGMAQKLHQATYSPEDNRLRIYPAYRLDRDDYRKLTDGGFKWAPKQKIFVAPMWTPNREDLAVIFCGEIDDEDTSLVDRAELRAERFEGYSGKRADEAHRTKEYVSSIADNIPFGQPILIGHHSEKHARRDAKRIETGMRKAVKLWETSKYWEMRAKSAKKHARYKERPDVRARRIKKIEAAKRKCERNINHSRSWLNEWLFPSILSKGRAMAIANFGRFYDVWSDLDANRITAREARNRHVPVLENSISENERWVNHYNNRLIYEKAMLEEQGASDLIKKKARPKQLPMLNYLAPDGILVINPSYYAEKTTLMPQVKMSKEQYKKIPKDYKGGRKVNGTHRVRICLGSCVPGALDGLYGLDRASAAHQYHAVFLTDSKQHDRPEIVEEKKQSISPLTLKAINVTQDPAPNGTEFDAMKDSLRKNGGVQTISVPQLFPTPRELSEKMAEVLDVSEGEDVLEPQAGTGNLLGAIGCRWSETGSATAVEINRLLCDRLEVEFPKTRIVCADFLECNGDLGQFDKIIMNPPFENGADIKHIVHATKFLKPGGRLVALCANGPRQNEILKPLAENSGGWWEGLPDGSFGNQGTSVRTVMLVVEG